MKNKKNCILKWHKDNRKKTKKKNKRDKRKKEFTEYNGVVVHIQQKRKITERIKNKRESKEFHGPRKPFPFILHGRRRSFRCRPFKIKKKRIFNKINADSARLI